MMIKSFFFYHIIIKRNLIAQNYKNQYSFFIIS